MMASPAGSVCRDEGVTACGASGRGPGARRPGGRCRLGDHGTGGPRDGARPKPSAAVGGHLGARPPARLARGRCLRRRGVARAALDGPGVPCRGRPLRPAHRPLRRRVRGGRPAPCAPRGHARRRPDHRRRLAYGGRGLQRRGLVGGAGGHGRGGRAPGRLRACGWTPQNHDGGAVGGLPDARAPERHLRRRAGGPSRGRGRLGLLLPRAAAASGRAGVRRVARRLDGHGKPGAGRAAAAAGAPARGGPRDLRRGAHGKPAGHRRGRAASAADRSPRGRVPRRRAPAAAQPLAISLVRHAGARAAGRR